MTHEVDDSEIRFLPTVLDEPGADMELRYMKRRKAARQDRNGDPLDGVINLFDVAIVLAVGFLLAALTGLGMTDVLTGEDMTVVTNPGTDDMQLIVKSGDTIERFDVQAGQEVSGVGTLIGSFYRLADGTTVYVPTTEAAPPGATPLPGTTAHGVADAELDGTGDACPRPDGAGDQHRRRRERDLERGADDGADGRAGQEGRRLRHRRAADADASAESRSLETTVPATQRWSCATGAVRRP